LKPETLESAFGLMHSMIQRVVLDATEICAAEMKIDKIDNLAKPFRPTIEELRKSTDQILLKKYAELRKQQSTTNNDSK
jgi:DNA repair ATPase RecN